MLYEVFERLIFGVPWLTVLVNICVQVWKLWCVLQVSWFFLSRRFGLMVLLLGCDKGKCI